MVTGKRHTKAEHLERRIYQRLFGPGTPLAMAITIWPAPRRRLIAAIREEIERDE